jgi:phospholipid/cholesterol/gamma-HCH transport system substrate-binding protein
MDANNPRFKLRLGLFIVIGLAIFSVAIFVIGKQKNLFDPVFSLTSNFYNVSGLQVGNNVRFSGINVGTVDGITIINDSTVRVTMLVKKSVNPFVKADCKVAIGSEGVIGDKLVIISQGTTNAPLATDGQLLESVEPVEMDAIMASIQITALNAVIISEQLAEIMVKVNSGSGTIGRLIQDSTMSLNIEQTISNLKKSSQGLDENMNAAKENFLLRGYFRRKEKAALKEQEEVDALKEEQQKASDKKK